MKASWIIRAENLFLCHDAKLRPIGQINSNKADIKFYRAKGYALRMVAKIGGSAEVVPLYEGDILDESGRIKRARKLFFPESTPKQRGEWLRFQFQMIIEDWKATSTNGYDWKIDTGIGPFSFRLSMDCNMIFGRFENAELASRMLGANRHSGKWNMYLGDPIYWANSFWPWVECVETLRAKVEFVEVGG